MTHNVIIYQAPRESSCTSHSLLWFPRRVLSYAAVWAATVPWLSFNLTGYGASLWGPCFPIRSIADRSLVSLLLHTVPSPAATSLLPFRASCQCQVFPCSHFVSCIYLACCALRPYAVLQPSITSSKATLLTACAYHISLPLVPRARNQLWQQPPRQKHPVETSLQC